MADSSGTNRDCVVGGSSYFQKTVVLGDWWLVKSHEAFEGKRFGLAGIELISSKGRRALRVFTSAPIVKVFDVFTLETADGICILIKGFINKERTIKNRFSPEVFRHFLFGFPPCWEEVLGKCFSGDSSEDDLDTMPDSNKWKIDPDDACHPSLTPCKNKEGFSKDKDDVATKRIPIDNSKLSSRSGNKQQRGSLLSRAKKRNNDGENVTKRGDVKNDDKDDINDDVRSPKLDAGMQEEHSISRVNEFSEIKGESKKTRKCVTKESVTSEKVKAKQNALRTCPHLQSKDITKSTETRRNTNSIKVSNSAVKDGVGDSPHHLETIVEEDQSCVQEEPSSREKSKRRIDFDVEATPKQEVKDKKALLSPDSLGRKRSRSGRLLVSTLEFWRNQVAVYDADRNIIGIQEDGNNKTTSTGSGSKSQRRQISR